MKREKKGQVTAFIIIALLLIGTIVVIFLFREKIIPKNKNKIIELDNINTILEDCMKQRAVDAILLAGLQGGYTSVPKNNIVFGDFNVGFAVFKGKNTLLSISEIGDEISNYIESTIVSCIDDQEFPGAIITQGIPESTVEIKKDFIEVSSKLPLSILKEDISVDFSESYKHEFPIRFIEIHEIANTIAGKHVRDPEFIDLTYLTSLEFDAIYSHYTETTLVYIISDPENKIGDVPFSFIFAIE